MLRSTFMAINRVTHSSVPQRQVLPALSQILFLSFFLMCPLKLNLCCKCILYFDSICPLYMQRMMSWLFWTQEAGCWLQYIHSRWSCSRTLVGKYIHCNWGSLSEFCHVYTVSSPLVVTGLWDLEPSCTFLPHLPKPWRCFIICLRVILSRGLCQD